MLGGRYRHVFRLALAFPIGHTLGCLSIAALHGADYVVANTHQSETLLGCELADGIALDGAVGEVEFCNHIFFALFVFYHYPCIIHVSLQTSAQSDKASSIELGSYLRKYPPTFGMW